MSGRSRFVLALVLVALTGFISLSYELLWVRLYSFVSASKAWAFGALLGSYLIGLALGSLWSLKFQHSGRGMREMRALAIFIGVANLIGYLVVPIVSWAVVYVHFLWTLPLVVFAAALLGAALPLICHFAIPADDKAGARISYLYLSNILGSGAGSLLTGFVLMDQFSLGEISLFLLMSSAILVLILSVISGISKRVTALMVMLPLVVFALGDLFIHVYERLQFKADYSRDRPFKKVVESRFGVITIDQDDKIYGGGIFDGYLGTELWPGSWMVRPYFLSAVHEAPREVLTIGLSGGTWAQILVSHPQVEKVTAIEINAAYSERVIPDIPATRSILQNPKLEIIIDDGRRWLRRHPERTFDAIVINMTYHWREHATNLLSKEFMELVKSHLNPGGIFLLNATGSDRVAKTATEVFPDVALLLNNVLASNQPLRYHKERWRQTLAAYQIDGNRLFPPGKESDLEAIVSMIDTIGQRDVEIARRVLTREQIIADTQGLSIITDDNLGHEFEW